MNCIAHIGTQAKKPLPVQEVYRIRKPAEYSEPSWEVISCIKPMAVPGLSNLASKGAKTKQTVRAAVFLSHGFGEYLVTYDRLVRALLGAHILVFGHDHVGFGRSGGKRAQIDSLDQYCKDVECHVACVKAKLKDIPMFIVGHSMGGCIAVGTGAQFPDLFDGVVLLSPGLAIDKKFNNATMRFIGRTLARVAPSAGLIQLEAAAITSDTSIIDKYTNDPLIYKGRLKAKWLHAFRMGIEHTVKRLPEVKWPFLCIQGGKDPWIPAEEIKKILDKASSPDKTVVIVPNALHRVFDEPNGIGDEVCRQVVEWIVKHIPPDMSSHVVQYIDDTA